MSGTEMIWMLKKRFDLAGVPLRIAPRPFVRGGRVRIDSGAMVMDIRQASRSAPGGEAVVLWPGEAHLEVRAVDPGRQQLVLDVRERGRAITIRFPTYPTRWHTQHVPADERAFLIGKDECRLFMAQLPGRASSVANARDMLAPTVLRSYRRVGVRVPRQGEHFFLPATASELSSIEETLRYVVPVPGPVRPQRAGIEQRRTGKPHHATKTLIVAGCQFVMGKIRHPDHHPLRLREWARPELNREAQTPLARGITWVD